MNTDEALTVLKTYLRTLKTTAAYPLDEDGHPAPADGSWSADSSPAADVAREWARELLTEADANGLGGCRLCRS